MADEILNNENTEDVLPEPILREEKYLSAIANNTAGGGGGGKVVIAEKTITANGTYNAVDDNANAYNPVTVNVANSYTAGDEGKVVSSGELVAQTSTTITQNGIVDTTLNNSVTVNVQASNTDLIDLIERDITTLDIPSGTTKIGDMAFQNCTSLTSITIPSSVTSISNNAFSGCSSLTTITVNQAEGSISGAPWGAPDATVVWTG